MVLNCSSVSSISVVCSGASLTSIPQSEESFFEQEASKNNPKISPAEKNIFLDFMR